MHCPIPLQTPHEKFVSRAATLKVTKFILLGEWGVKRRGQTHQDGLEGLPSNDLKDIDVNHKVTHFCLFCEGNYKTCGVWNVKLSTWKCIFRCNQP